MSRKRPPFTRRGEQAIQAFQEASSLDAIPRLDDGDEVVYSRRAQRARARGDVLLTPTQAVSVSAGEAVSWDNKPDELYVGAHARIIDTLEHPNTISAGASTDRMSAAIGAGVLESAVDAAVSAQAANSLEKMLCHQMAALHSAAMRLLEQSAEPALPPVEVARFTNAAARLIDAYQSGCVTLQKLKTGGTQRVLVQHQQVNVGQGGQAVVAGRMDGGSRRGRPSKNGR